MKASFIIMDCFYPGTIGVGAYKFFLTGIAYPPYAMATFYSIFPSWMYCIFGLFIFSGGEPPDVCIPLFRF
jgi:hypothetical protein